MFIEQKIIPILKHKTALNLGLKLETMKLMQIA